MDRKTLLAFLIIAVIILLTPAYYNIVYPTTENEFADSSATIVRRAADPVTSYTKPIKENTSLQPVSVFENKIYSVQTNLYSATISSFNGGS